MAIELLQWHKITGRKIYKKPSNAMVDIFVLPPLFQVKRRFGYVAWNERIARKPIYYVQEK